MDEPKACPFCGGKAFLADTTVSCRACGASIAPQCSELSAIAVWNCRADDSEAALGAGE